MQSIAELLKEKSPHTPLKENNNLNVNNVRAIASKISDQLNDQKSFKYFCKVAWNLPERTIWNNLELAMTKQSPAKYFTWLCNYQLGCGR